MFLTIATAGHIDHGKSALVQALTGTNPDRLKEEQARGISIELGFAHVQVGDTTLSFVDVPGHERFVRTMLAGVVGIDAVLLVVSADESVMPQTREHLAICRLLGVPAAVVALTRCDLADDLMQAVAIDDVRTLLAGTPFAGSEIVPVSARTHAGLEALRAALVRCAHARPLRDDAGPPRLPIDRVFTVKGFGTVVTGTLWTGSMTAGASVRLEPSGRDVRVRSLQVHGQDAARAAAGQRVAANLAGVSPDDVRRGDVLVGEGLLAVSRRLAVDVQVLDDAPPLRHGARMHVHLGTASVLGRLLLPRQEDPAQPRAIAPGTHALALVRLEEPLPARRGDRLVLRTYSPVTTVAGGVVIDPVASMRTADVARLAATAPGAPAAWLAARVGDAGATGLAAADLPARCGLSPKAARALAGEVARTGAIVEVGGRWVSSDSLSAMRERLLVAVDEAHAADALAGGVPRATLRAGGGRRWPSDVADYVLTQLVAEGVLEGDDRLGRRGVRTSGFDGIDAVVRAAVAEGGLKGRTMEEIERAATGVDRKVLPATVARLVKARSIERIGDGYVAGELVQALAAELREWAEAGEGPAVIEVGWFKDRYGLTRRTAIPLLEWLDRTRVTRREGDARVLIGS